MRIPLLRTLSLRVDTRSRGALKKVTYHPTLRSFVASLLQDDDPGEEDEWIPDQVGNDNREPGNDERGDDAKALKGF